MAVPNRFNKGLDRARQIVKLTASMISQHRRKASTLLAQMRQHYGPESTGTTIALLVPRSFEV
jgi:hypothetical protein